MRAVTTRDVFGVSRERARFRLPEVTIDGRTFKDLSAMLTGTSFGPWELAVADIISPGDIDGILGHDFSRPCRLYRYQRRELRVR